MSNIRTRVMNVVNAEDFGLAFLFGSYSTAPKSSTSISNKSIIRPLVYG